MSIEFTVEHSFTHPPDRVFHVLTDLESTGKWMPNFIRIERLTEGFGVGTEWRETRKMFGKEATEQFEVTSCEPPRRMSIRIDGTKGTSKKGEFVFDYILEPDGAGTRLEMRGEIRGLGGVAGMFGKMMVGPFKKACAKDLDAMARHLDQM